jgi:hypothetical protein
MSKKVSRRRKSVIVLEDDAFLASAIESTIRAKGFLCNSCASIGAAEVFLSKPAPDYLIADLAVPLGKSVLFDTTQTHGGHCSGLEFVKFARQRWVGVECLIIAGNPTRDVANWCSGNGVAFRPKPIDTQHIDAFIGTRPRRAFVVHGRNIAHVGKIKAALAKVGIEPVVLFEQPSKGRTIIEKFEAVSAGCDFAVVALSGDDLVCFDRYRGAAAKLRARQNVIFELGYFYGRLSRMGGQAVLVDFGGVEIPSDISGIIRVNGEGAVGTLAKELASELSP